MLDIALKSANFALLSPNKNFFEANFAFEKNEFCSKIFFEKALTTVFCCTKMLQKETKTPTLCIKCLHKINVELPRIYHKASVGKCMQLNKAFSNLPQKSLLYLSRKFKQFSFAVDKKARLFFTLQSQGFRQTLKHARHQSVWCIFFAQKRANERQNRLF